MSYLHAGDLYFEKAVNGFLSDLFAKWKVWHFFLSAFVVTRDALYVFYLADTYNQ